MKKHFALKQAKPFLKWAGGKGQLIEQIDTYLLGSFKEGKMKKYFEPFLGGGALWSRYKNPTICNEVNLFAVSKLRRKAEIVCGDDVQCVYYTDNESFIDFDTPYYPASKTASFIS